MRAPSLPSTSSAKALRGSWCGPALLSALLLSASPLVSGCAGARANGAHAETGAAGPGPVPGLRDDELAGAVRDLLTAAPGSAERARLLKAVLSRQMDRAVARFHRHETERGLACVIGGLYLARTGELQSDTLGPAAPEALREAARDLAARGDEGRARALYEILKHIAPAPERSDIDDHLHAIAAWTKDELKAGPGTIATGTVETASVARSLLEPSHAAKSDAASATVDWINAALDLQARFRDKKAHPTREEVGEAVRALHTGNDVLAQIYLRDADAAGAVRALKESPANETVRPELQRALDALSPASGAGQWLDVLHVLTPVTSSREQEEEEAMEDRELARAASFGVALEAYRLNPKVPEAAALVAAVLQEVGFAEASPAVIVEATKAHAEPRTLAGALAITLRAMSLELEANDVDAVRRAYAAAMPLLALATASGQGASLSPSPGHVRAMMGEVELSQGQLGEARALLGAAAAEERSGEVLLSLARIDRHDGHAKAALDDLREAAAAPDTASDAALNGEILLLESDLYRDGGDAAGARAPLVSALATLVKARTQGAPEARARIEQVLSRVLDRFGAKQKAQEALERAFEATPHDKRQIAATLQQIVARAFVKKDLLAAKDGLTRAIASELDDDDLVYYALWVRLLERQLKKPVDPAHDSATARIFASIPDDGHWVGKLAAFGAGKLPASQLTQLAKTQAERTEATFYAVMESRTQGTPDPGNAGLRAVISGDGVDLMEAVIARELLRDAAGETPLPLPPGIKLP
jgi:cellulose synthase operon protein C